MSSKFLIRASLVAQMVRSLPAKQERRVPSMGSGGNGNPLHDSFLENSMDRGAWRAIVQRVAKELDVTLRLNDTMHIRTSPLHHDESMMSLS